MVRDASQNTPARPTSSRILADNLSCTNSNPTLVALSGSPRSDSSCAPPRKRKSNAFEIADSPSKRSKRSDKENVSLDSRLCTSLGDVTRSARKDEITLKLKERSEVLHLLQRRNSNSNDSTLYKTLIAHTESLITEAQLELAAFLSKTRRFSVTLSSVENVYHDEIMAKLRDFGLPSFRLLQYEIITASLSGRDCVVLMPTGSGKSLTYQLPAICTSGKTCGLTIVVSPLISLMKQQCESLRALDIQAVNASEERDQGYKNRLALAQDQPIILYCTPEKLAGNNYLNHVLDDLYESKRLARFVVDEAHCVPDWGRTFRKAYQKLGEHITIRFSGIPITALTGTATEGQLFDIVRQLHLRDPLVFRYPSNRSNLFYQVIQKPRKGLDAMDKALQFIQTEYPGKTGLVYCMTKKQCENVAGHLQDNGVFASFYHAGMSTQERSQAQDDWLKGDCHVMVATTAFGMGVDKSNVRFVIHFELPRSISEYIQETGRSGRDGIPSKCLLMYRQGDYKRLVAMTKKDNIIAASQKQHQIRQIQLVRQYCLNADCRRVILLRALDEHSTPADCGNGCDNCIQKATGTVMEHDLTQESKDFVKYLQGLTDEAKGFEVCRAAYIDSHSAALVNHPPFCPSDLLDMIMSGLEMQDVIRYRYDIADGEIWRTQFVELGAKARDFLSGKGNPVVLRHHDWQELPNPQRSRASGKATTSQTQRVPDSEDLYYTSDEEREGEFCLIVPGPSSGRSGERNKVITVDLFSDDSEEEGNSMEIEVFTSQVSSGDFEVDRAQAVSDMTILDELRRERDRITTEENIRLETYQGMEHPILSDEAIEALGRVVPADYSGVRKVVSNAYYPGRPPLHWKDYELRFVVVCVQWRQRNM